MKIQNFEIPKESMRDMENMYIRKQNSKVQIQNDTILFSFGGKISFDTYFNSFSIEKWRKYTGLNSLKICYKACGKLRLKIWNEFLEDSQVKKELVCSDEIENETDKLIDYILNIPIRQDEKGIFSLEVESLSEEAELGSLSYQTDDVARHDITIAIDICTYKREQDICHNLNVLEKIIENKKSELYQKLHVFVSDNGKTLTRTSNEFIHIYPNKNAGGTAGFTRGMIEILNYQNKEFSHILLMDDDVEISVSAFEKNYAFLSLIKEEYVDSILGGAMLRRDVMYIQQEAGAQYKNGTIVSLRSKIDLRKKEEILLNEVAKEKPDYNAWWYCCLPIKCIEENQFPLPLFIHEDDVEYGIRCEKEVILLNGICVWHQAFENKRPSSNEYYDVRNTLIVNAIHSKEFSKRHVIKIACKRMLTNLFRMRYKDIELVYWAVQDFLNGVEWLERCDAEKLHQDIMKKGYCYKECTDSDLLERIKNKSIEKGVIISSAIDKRKLVTLNGWLLPAYRENQVKPICAGDSPHEFYRIKRAWIYDPDSMKGFYTKKRYREFVSLLAKCIKICIIVNAKFKKTIKGYRGKYTILCTKEFWNHYLEIKEIENEKV